MRRHRQQGQLNKKRKRIQLPITARQVQKLLRSKGSQGVMVDCLWANGIIKSGNLAEAIAVLDRLAQSNPNHLIEEFQDEGEDYDGDYEFEFEEEDDEQIGANSPDPDPQPAAENREEGEARPKDTDEVAPQSGDPQDGSLHGGDGNSGEVNAAAQTSSLKRQKPQSQPASKGQGAGDGVPQDGQAETAGRSASDAPQPSGSETDAAKSEAQQKKGEVPSSGFTSEGTGQGEDAQSSSHQSENTPSTALGDADRPDGQSHDAFASDQPRDAGALESGDSRPTDLSDAPDDTDGFREEVVAEGEGDRAGDDSGNCPDASPTAIENGVGEDARTQQPGDDRPTHQKKWGKKFGKAEKAKLSAAVNHNHGGMTASLQRIGVDAKLLKLCRQRLSELVGDASQDYSPRWDYQEFCVRLKTYRNPRPARREETGRPVILIMADVSGSCSGFSEESVMVAKAASKLGVPGADVLVLSHSNGYPCELEHNGKVVPLDAIAVRSGYEHAHTNAGWYDALTRRYQIQAVVALGDWDAADDYVRLAQNPMVDRFIWLDNAHCSSRGTVLDRSKMALKNIQEMGVRASSIRHKFVYRDGCGDAVAFIENII